MDIWHSGIKASVTLILSSSQRGGMEYDVITSYFILISVLSTGESCNIIELVQTKPTLPLMHNLFLKP